MTTWLHDDTVFDLTPIVRPSCSIISSHETRRDGVSSALTPENPGYTTTTWFALVGSTACPAIPAGWPAGAAQVGGIAVAAFLVNWSFRHLNRALRS